MRLLRQILLLTGMALALGLPAAAGAQTTVPPGNSGANQYTETLPGAGGNEPTSDIGHGKNDSPQKALGKKHADRLESLGPAGQATANLAAKGAPVPAGTQAHGHHRAKGGAGGGNNSRTPPANPGGSSGAGQIFHQLVGSDSGSEGMGALLPLLIGVAALSAAAFVAIRRRTTAH